MSLNLESNSHQNNLNRVKSSDSIIYGFGDYRLDVAHLMLYHDGTEVPLTPKQAETLLALIEQQGEIVSKEELMKRLWGDSAVEESNLIQNIYVLRKVLGDTHDGRPMIETLRRRGYRFNEVVTEHRHRLTEVSAAMRLADLESALIRSADDGLANPNETSAAGSAPKNRTLAFTAAGAILVVLIAGGYFALRTANVAAERKKLAVLPLKAIRTSDRNTLFEIGIADSMIQRLGSNKDFVVSPLSSVGKYVDREHAPVAAGNELKADYVLASNYELVNGRIKVTAQLLNMVTGKVEETLAASADSTDSFSAREAIAKDLSYRLIKRLGSAAVAAQTKRGTDNDEAYKLYLMAMNVGEERGIQNLLKSLEYIDQAVAIDPNYSKAWAAKAHLHNDIVGHTDTRQTEHFKLSSEAIDRALAIDPNVSEAYSALCSVKFRHEYDVNAAESACERAIELDPDSPLAYKTYTTFLYSRGRFDEAINQITRAIELQPVSYRNQQIYGLSLYYARRFEEAEAQFKHLLALNPNHAYIPGQLVSILELQEKEPEAFEYLLKRLALMKADSKTIERFKRAYARSGWRGVTLERINTPEVETVPGPFRTACLYARIGEKDKAFEFLERAFRERSFRISVIQVEPLLDPIRSDPRYHDLLRRVGFTSN